MKKILCLFSAALLVLSSCTSSSDDSFITDPAPVSMILPKSVKSTDLSDSNKYSTSTISYEGNKIKSIMVGDDRTDFIYDGNLIAKQTGYYKGVKGGETTYTYANGKLASSSYVDGIAIKYPTGQYKGRSVYTYNADGTIKTVSYSTDVASGVETKNGYETLSTITNGNLVKVVVTDINSGAVQTVVYEYDAKNSPLKNIAGFNLLVVESSSNSSNNEVKSTQTSSDSASGTFVYKIGYEYNTNGYPTKATSYKSDGAKVDAITEYTY